MQYWMFDDPFHNKEPVLVILVPGMIKPLESGSSLVVEAYKVTSEDFRVIQVLEFSFALMF